MNERLYLFGINLVDIEPLIWRRFVVPASITLDRLHDVIQIVMGWTDSHLHQFIIGKKKYTEDPEYKEDGSECGKYRLGDLIKQKGRGFEYLYDFGDGWQHDLILQDNRYASSDLHYEIACLNGARACPPEDVGGIRGYYEFLKILSDPDHEDCESIREWIGVDFDSERFDVDQVNWDLVKYLRWSRNRYLRWNILS